MSIELRRVTADDWQLLRDVRLRALADAPEAFGSTLAQAESLTEGGWRQRADNGGLTLLALDDGHPVAMGGAFAPDDGPTVFVWGMWTDPVARGHGVGGQLLDALVAWCRPSYDEVRLHVTEGNDGARRLYVSRGFEPTGTWEPLCEGSPLQIEELRLLLHQGPTQQPRIAIEAHDERWPAEFERIAAALAGALGEVALRIDHIGSTSVPGLAAKDVIDVQVTVADLADPRLEAGFRTLGATPTEHTRDHVPPGATDAPGEWSKRMFRAPSSWRRTHLHVREVGRGNQRYALLFRDYLRSSPSAATAYARVKTALAQLHPDDADAYYAVKDPVCDLVMEAAEQWAHAVGWSPDGGTTHASRGQVSC
ncbi:bifunctional GNAT family N-acetyltransferase/GrpB family protein [Nocardioides rubriscoriae]|uniref:bifunctional GNAT family N-acetyltransferase/GrpB family protein n=1 Tax=Nocardioides rubriscoriae TaxID=642762 RepID=UPI0011DF0336|nr:bifunctional GNAT family N-acetyltransferase/GrpB family protein [Nocardioides rubriscoriae]